MLPYFNTGKGNPQMEIKVRNLPNDKTQGKYRSNEKYIEVDNSKFTSSSKNYSKKNKLSVCKEKEERKKEATTGSNHLDRQRHKLKNKLNEIEIKQKKNQEECRIFGDTKKRVLPPRKKRANRYDTLLELAKAGLLNVKEEEDGTIWEHWAIWGKDNKFWEESENDPTWYPKDVKHESPANGYYQDENSLDKEIKERVTKNKEKNKRKRKEKKNDEIMIKRCTLKKNFTYLRDEVKMISCQSKNNTNHVISIDNNNDSNQKIKEIIQKHRHHRVKHLQNEKKKNLEVDQNAQKVLKRKAYELRITKVQNIHRIDQERKDGKQDFRKNYQTNIEKKNENYLKKKSMRKIDNELRQKKKKKIENDSQKNLMN